MLKGIIWVTSIFFLFSIIKCNEKKQIKFNENFDLNEDRFNKIKIRLTEEGILRVTLSSKKLVRKKIEYSPEMISEFSDSFVGLFYGKTGKIESHVTANYCRVNERTRDMYIRDNVHIVTTKGDIINCNNLTWNNSTQKFTTPDYIDIQRPNQHIKGIGFEGNSDLSEYKIYKSIGQTQTKTISF